MEKNEENSIGLGENAQVHLKEDRVNKENQENAEKIEKERKREKEVKVDRRVKYFLIIILIIFSSLIVAFAFKENITDLIKKSVGTTFAVKNFDFEKVYYGELPMYQTEIYVSNFGNTLKYNLLLRNDPRDLYEKIDVFVVNPQIMRRAYFSLTPETDDCNETIVSSWKIGEFLFALGINISGAVTDITAIANTSYADDPERVKTCEDAINSTVIILQKSKSDISFISQEYQGKVYKDCFVLNYADCDTTAVTERFILFLMEEFNKNNTI